MPGHWNLEMNYSVLTPVRLCISVLFFLLICSLLEPVLAGQLPVDTNSELVTAFKEFTQDIKQYIYALTANNGSSSIYNFSAVLYKFFSFVLISIFLVRYSFEGFYLDEALNVVILIAGVKLLMSYYPDIIFSVWGLFLGLTESIQGIALSGNKSEFSIFGYFLSLWDHVQYPRSLFDIGNMVRGIVLFFVFAVFLLGALMATAWANWGFAIAAIIGYLFIPLIMFTQTRAFFMGWLRFFLGFCLYALIARIILVIVFMVTIALLEIPMNFPLSIPSTMDSYVVDLGSSSYLIFLLLLMMGALSMFAVGSFSSTIASTAVSSPSLSRLTKSLR